MIFSVSVEKEHSFMSSIWLSGHAVSYTTYYCVIFLSQWRKNTVLCPVVSGYLVIQYLVTQLITM